MGAIAKRYVDGAQAANMLKAVLNKLMDDLSTGDPPADPPGLPTFGKPVFAGSNPDDGYVRGRKADQSTPPKPQRSRSARQKSTAPASRRVRSTTPARFSREVGKGNGKEEPFDWKQHQRKKREAAEDRHWAREVSPGSFRPGYRSEPSE